jgi:hypothetical protein
MVEQRRPGSEAGKNTHEDSLAVSNEEPRKPVFAEDGTDLTLIRESLSRTPLERIRALEAAIRSINRLRDAVET